MGGQPDRRVPPPMHILTLTVKRRIGKEEHANKGNEGRQFLLLEMDDGAVVLEPRLSSLWLHHHGSQQQQQQRRSIVFPRIQHLLRIPFQKDRCPLLAHRSFIRSLRLKLCSPPLPNSREKNSRSLPILLSPFTLRPWL